MSADETNTLVRGLGSIPNALRDADPLDKAEIYSDDARRAVERPGRSSWPVIGGWPATGPLSKPK